MNGKLNMPIEVELSCIGGDLCEEAHEQLKIFCKRMQLIRLLCADPQLADRPVKELTKKFDRDIFRDEFKCALKYTDALYKRRHSEGVDGAFQKIIDDFVPSAFQRVLGFSGDIHYTTQTILNARELAYLSALIVGDMFNYPTKFRCVDLWTELGEALRCFLGAMTKIHQHVIARPKIDEDFICVISYNQKTSQYDENVISFDQDDISWIYLLETLYGLRHMVATTTPMQFVRTTDTAAHIPIAIILVDRHRYGKWHIYFLRSKNILVTLPVYTLMPPQNGDVLNIGGMTKDLEGIKTEAGSATIARCDIESTLENFMRVD